MQHTSLFQSRTGQKRSTFEWMARWQKQIDTKFYKAAQVAAAQLWVGPGRTEPVPAQSESLLMDNPPVNERPTVSDIRPWLLLMFLLAPVTYTVACLIKPTCTQASSSNVLFQDLMRRTVVLEIGRPTHATICAYATASWRGRERNKSFERRQATSRQTESVKQLRVQHSSLGAG